MRFFIITRMQNCKIYIVSVMVRMLRFHHHYVNLYLIRFCILKLNLLTIIVFTILRSRWWVSISTNLISLSIAVLVLLLRILLLRLLINSYRLRLIQRRRRSITILLLFPVHLTIWLLIVLR